MKDLNLIESLGTKNATDNNKITSSEWNKFVQTLIALGSSLGDNISTFTVKALNTTTKVWESYTPTVEGTSYKFELGKKYKISGYTTNNIVISGTATNSTKDTTVILDSVYIKTAADSVISYTETEEKKTFKIFIKENTENFLIQTKSNADSSKAVIYSNTDLNIRGFGYLYLENAAGHGIKGEVLNIKDMPHIYFNVSHDAIHGTRAVNIYNGKFKVETCNDVVGVDKYGMTGSSGTVITASSGKLKGLIRIFGGEYNVDYCAELIFDYDNTYPTIYVINQTVEVEGSTKTKECFYGDISSDELSAATVEYVMHSKIFSPFVKIYGNGITSSNIKLALFKPFQETGSVKVGDTEITKENGVYDCTSTESVNITVSGYIEGLILTSTGAEVTLDNATLNPLTSLVEGLDTSYLNKCILYGSSSSNVTIKCAKNSEASYIYGEVYSINNIKIQPKANSNLYVQSPTDGFYAGTITVYNGGGNLYLYNCEGSGIHGNEVIIGNEISTKAKDDSGINKNGADNRYSGEIYGFNNKKFAIYSRVSSKNKKATITTTNDNDGTVIVDIIGTAKSSLYETSTTTIANTGLIQEGYPIKTTESWNYDIHSIYYEKLPTFTTVYGSIKYGNTFGKLSKHFD